MKRIATQEAVKLRLRITSRGTRAWAPARRSIGTKARIRTTARASRPSTRGSLQPQSSTWSSATSSETSPIESVANPGVVDPPLARLRLLDVDQHVGDEHREDRDRDVEEEDPAPAEGVGEDAADQRSDGVAEAGGAEDDPAGQARFLFRQDREGHAEDRRPHQRPADPHQGAAGDQPGLRLGGAAERRHRSEDRGAEEEGVAASEHVGEATAGDDHHPEGQRVGVDHPLDRVDVGVEVLLHRRQGDVDRREVVGDHHHRDAHRGEGEPIGAPSGSLDAAQPTRPRDGIDAFLKGPRHCAKLASNGPPARQPRASPSPPPSGGIALGGAIAARDRGHSIQVEKERSDGTSN